MQQLSEVTIQEAITHLRAYDPRLAVVIDSAPPCSLQPHTHYYEELVDSIISQQLSVGAARTIERRFRGLFGDRFPSPEEIIERDVTTLRSIGLSRAKASYILDLAEHILDGRVRFDHLDALTNDQIIAELTAVKGIGVWTAHMFMMFCMGRADVLATGDLGIRKGIQKLYALDELPPPETIEAIARDNNWHPYASVACWYVWRVLDNN